MAVEASERPSELKRRDDIADAVEAVRRHAEVWNPYTIICDRTLTFSFSPIAALGIEKTPLLFE